MKVKIWFQLSSQPINFENVYATYQKGDLICIGYKDKDGKQAVNKYPIAHLFAIKEYDFESSQP